jgi:hemolysin activation/secretion protein
MATFTVISSSPAQETNAPAKPAGKAFFVSRYEVAGNTVLPQAQIDSVLTNHTGNAVTITDLKKGLGELQLLYRNFGFPTIYVSLPQQKITNGVVHVDVVEGRLSSIKIEGNRWFSVPNVLRALPGLNTNVLLDTKWFQTELDLANGNVDRQIYPVIGPGADPDTTELTLRVKDRFPLHWHIEVDNKSTPGTPPLRIDTAAQYNNLWQLEQQAGVQYNFTPQQVKQDNYLPNDFWDQPRVDSYSAFYRIPFGSAADGLREFYERQPADFGYDYVTHKFDLPPATGKPELTFYASRSASETPVAYGPQNYDLQTADVVIVTNSNERSVSFNENIGSKLVIPVKQFANTRSSFTLGMDFKQFQSRTYFTNVSVASFYTTNNGTLQFLGQTTDINSNNTSLTVRYLPLNAGWFGSRPDKWGNTTFGIGDVLYLSALQSPRANFQSLANSSRAGGTTTSLNASLSREQDLPRDWSVLFRANGQWSAAPLINNEQFGIGGTAGVRGYQEGSDYGDSGWRMLLDLRAPAADIGAFPRDDGNDLPAQLRCSLFMDGGEVYNYSRPGQTDSDITQWGTGLGFYFTAGEHIDARLTLAWALLDTPSTSAGGAQAYFSVNVQY